MKKPDHPFYCDKKHCQKSAWDTPEYLSEGDWSVAEAMIAALEAGDEARFHDLVTREQEAVFYRIVAWPEGRNYYCYGSEVYRGNCFLGFVARDLPRLKTAVAARHGELFASAAA
jgi:hypothetical protein